MNLEDSGPQVRGKWLDEALQEYGAFGFPCDYVTRNDLLVREWTKSENESSSREGKHWPLQDLRSSREGSPDSKGGCLWQVHWEGRVPSNLNCKTISSFTSTSFTGLEDWRSHCRFKGVIWGGLPCPLIPLALGMILSLLSPVTQKHPLSTH